MKQKKSLYIFQLAAYLFATWYLIFPYTSVAQSNFCSFSITSFEAQNLSAADSSVVNKNSSVQIYVKANLDQTCLKSYTLVLAFQIKTKSGYSTVTTKEIATPQNGQLDTNFTYDLSNFSGWNNLPNAQNLEYTLSASARYGAVSQPLGNTNTWGKYLNITGQGTGGTTTSGTGNLSIQLSLDKAEAVLGSNLFVDIKVNGRVTDPTALQKSYKILTYVNSTWVGQFRDLTSAQLTQPHTQEITVSSQNGFKQGSNTIKVEAYEQTSNTVIASATTNISMGLLNSPTVSYTPQKSSYTEGETIQLSFGNGMPQGFVGQVRVNDSPNTLPCSNNPCNIVLSASNGFKVSGTNTLSVSAKTSSGQNIQLSNPNITLGQNTGGASKKYACKDGAGIYQCSDKKDLTDVKVKTGDCQWDYTSPDTGDAQQVDACWCSKTDDQIKTQCTTTTPGGNNNGQTFNCNGANAKNDPNYSKFCLINPLPSDNLIGTFLSITKGFLAGLAIWAVIAIIFAGFRMVVAAGNEEAITQAKKAITWAIIGLVVALLSFSIVAIVQNILKVDVSKLNPNGMNKEVSKHNYL